MLSLGVPLSVVTGHAAALFSVGAAVAAITIVVGVVILHKDRATPSAAPEKTTSPAITATQSRATTSIVAAPPARTTSAPEPASRSRTALPAWYDSTSVAEKPSAAKLLCKGHWFEHPCRLSSMGIEAVKGCTPS